MSSKKNIKSVVTNLVNTIQSNKNGSMENGGDNPPWVNYVAMLTGILAALSGFLVVRSTNLTNDAIYESNQAILAQAQASDAWAEYQANSIKARIVETQIMATGSLSANDRKSLADQDEDVRARQPENKKAANDKELARDSHLEAGSKNLADRDLLGYASLAAQLGIALASVAAMVRKRIAFDVGAAVGLVGVAITAYVFIHHYLNP
jgi:Domain of unknown function (DUF4337)